MMVATRSVQAAPPEWSPRAWSIPSATAAPADVDSSEARLNRELADTSVISGGSSRGVTAALVTA
jgi:hypothetical protein